MVNIKDIPAEACHLTRPILYSQDLSIGYHTKSGVYTLEEDLNIKIHNGELVCLIGPNGCGKSTLMRTIAGLQKQLKGETFISGVNLKKMKPHKYAQLLSLVLTDKVNVDSFTVHDIVSIGRYPYLNYFAKLEEADHKIINESLEKVHLESYAQRFFNELSDGEKQRVLIAKALAQDTPLIMLDEPTAHLDLPNRVEIMNILNKLAKETNKAILLSTHELDLALQTADTIWLMNHESSLRSGTPEDMVLNGAFENVFSGNAFDFDKSTGSFKVKHPTKAKVYLQGEGLVYIWTKRALEREGYKVTNDRTEAIHIKVKDKKWLSEIHGKRNSDKDIAGLLSNLRHSGYFKSKQEESNLQKILNPGINQQQVERYLN